MEQILDILPQLIIGISTAIATILGVIKTNGNKIDKLSSDMVMISRDINRLTLHDEHLAIEERLSAGDRYIKSNGNGATKAYYEKLVEIYKKDLKT